MDGIPLDRSAFFIAGTWVPPVEVGRDPIEVVNPATARLAGRVPAGSPADVDRAVAAARTAFGPWSRSAPATRAALLRAVAAGLQRRQREIAEVISAEMGAPIDNALEVQTGLAIEVVASYAALVEEFEWREPRGGGLVVHEPAGVVAAVTAWNYPLYLAVAKVAAALAAGCTVVLKPSEDAPLDAFLLVDVVADACAEVGADPAVLNLVTGSRTDVGEPLVAHPGVDVVSFTGSTGSGRQVAAAAAATVKRVGLELGGKSATVVLADSPDGSTVTDLATVVRESLADVFFNSGQTCTARARLLVPSACYDHVLELARVITGSWALGDPAEHGEHLGPVVGRRHRDTVVDWIRRGIADGARVVAGGPEAPTDVPQGLQDGYWVRPTVLADLGPSAAVAREEIFGPVACILRYDDEAHALELANDSDYGLSGAVWCADEDRAVVFSFGMRTGSVTVNGAPFDPLAPAGGYKQSGNGRELGVHGLLEYLEVKSVQLPARAALT